MGACCTKPPPVLAPKLADVKEDGLLLPRELVLLPGRAPKACCCCCCPPPQEEAFMYLFSDHIVLKKTREPQLPRIKLFKPGFRVIFNEQDAISPTGVSLLFLPKRIRVYPTTVRAGEAWMEAINLALRNKDAKHKYRLEAAKEAALVLVNTPRVQAVATTAVAAALVATAGPITSAAATPVIMRVGLHQANRVLNE